MTAPLQLAAQRINAATAGITGSPTAPETNPGAVGGKGSGAVPLASASELTQLLPTEFGDLTSLFGGEAAPSAQYEPMQTAVTIPGGSVRGALGGLVPDFRSTWTKVAAPIEGLNPGGPEQAPAAAPPQVVPISTALKNYTNRFRAWAKI